MRDLIIDCFAGGGGASVGIEMALGRPVDIAINHDPDAILMHKTNHPDTVHLTEDIFKVDLQKYVKDRHVALIWASPDCTSHSKAKGGQPRKKGLRILPWAVFKHAKQILPDVIIMENVEEIQQWGPLDEQGHPIPERKGEDYKKFITAMKSLGYIFDSRELVAADYGAPTTRKRWYAIFRRDGKDIIWPEPTHSKGGANGLNQWEPIYKYLDLDDWGKSIFGRKKPLAKNTMNRIARGLEKFVFNNPEPFIVQVNHSGDNFRGQSIHEPMPTITGKHGYGVVEPYMVQIGQTGFSADRSKDVREPLTTIVSKNEHCLISPTLIQYHSETNSDEVRGQGIENPIMTVDSSNRYGLVTSFLSKFYKTGIGQDEREPLHTVTTSAGHFGEVRAFLIKYYGEGTGQDIEQPLDTVTSRDRFGLVTIQGVEYQIVDIGLRMLEPKELYGCQGFPDDYIIDHDSTGKTYSRSEQVKRCGNAVCPPIPAAMVRSNLPELCVRKRMPNLKIGEEESGQLCFV